MTAFLIAYDLTTASRLFIAVCHLEASLLVSLSASDAPEGDDLPVHSREISLEGFLAEAWVILHQEVQGSEVPPKYHNPAVRLLFSDTQIYYVPIGRTR